MRGGRPQSRRIATKEGEGELVDHVLGPFSGEELPRSEAAEARAAEAVLDWIANGVEHCMNEFNRPVEDVEQEQKEEPDKKEQKGKQEEKEQL